MIARLQRREFLRAALLQLGVWPLAYALGCSGDGSAQRSDAGGGPKGTGGEPVMPPPPNVPDAVRKQVAGLGRDDALVQYFEEGDHLRIADLGARYLAAFAPAGDLPSVRAALLSAVSYLERPVSDDEVIDDLRAAIYGEFSARRVVDLEGWTLAPTELALCALLWLSEQPLPDAGMGDAATGPVSGDAGPIEPAPDAAAGG